MLSASAFLSLLRPGQRRKSVFNFGGQTLGKLGKVQAPMTRSCDCRSQEALTTSGSGGADAIFNILCQNGVHFWIC